MKHSLPSSASAPVTPATITVLRCASALRIDPDPLSVIYADLGAEAAEDTICRVLEDIALRLNALQDLRRACQFSDMVSPAQRVSVVARHIGLMEVTIAADHVARTAEQGDGVALEATLSRLERGFDIAISEIWDVGNTAPI